MSRRLVMANPRSGSVIEGKALQIIRYFQPQVLTEPMPFDIERFFDCELETLTGVKSDYQILPNGIHGYTDSEAMESVISQDLMDISQIYFARSTISHEVGHAIIHVPEFRLKKAILTSIHNKNHGLTLLRESEIPLYKNPEWQAWRFALALLMPETMVKLAISGGATERNLCDIFQINPAFVRSRLRSLKLK